MKVGKGYTILEVLIFIAVSALVFVSAIGAVNGRQQQVQFSQAVRDLESKLSDIKNDVTTGFFPASDQIDCVVTAGGGPQIRLATGSPEELGTNDDCIFVGKAVQFRPDTGSDQLLIYNLVGSRYNASDEIVTNIQEANPVAVAVANDDLTEPLNQTIEVYRTRFGLEVTDVKDFNNVQSSGRFGVIGFLNRFSSAVSEAQTVQTSGILGTSLNENVSSAVGDINRLTDDITQQSNDGYFNAAPSNDLLICVQEAGGGRKAAIVLQRGSGSGTQLIFDDTTVLDMECS